MALLPAAVLLDNPVLVMCALVATAVGLLSRWLPLDVAVPSAVLTVLFTALLAGVVADGLDVDLLARPRVLVVVYLAVAWAAVLVGQRGTSGAPRAVRPAPYGAVSVVAYLPALGAAATGLLHSGDERSAASWVFVGTDAGRHIGFVMDAQRSGALDYTTNGYPRAMHVLDALVSVPGRGLGSASEALAYDLRLVASTTVLALALVLWTGACLALRISDARGLARATAVTAATAGAVQLLALSAYVRDFVFQASAPSMLASVVLCGLPLAALVLRPGRQRLLVLVLVAATSTVLLSHLWQALAPAPALGLLAVLGPQLRRPRHLLRAMSPRPAVLGLAVVWCLGAALLSALPLQAIAAQGGLDLAAIPGRADGPPALLLLGAALALPGLLLLVRHDWARALLGVGAAVVGVTAVLLEANGQGLDLTQYYPQKALWFLVVLMLPLCAVVVVRPVLWSAHTGLQLLGRIRYRAQATRVVVTAVVVALLVAFVAPLLVVRQPAAEALLGLHDWAASSSRRYDIAQQHALAYAPAVAVPVSLGKSSLPDREASGIISRLMSLQTGQPTNVGDPQDVCEDVQLVAGSRSAVVVTALDRTYLRGLMERRGCGGTRVVQVPGGGADPVFLPER